MPPVDTRKPQRIQRKRTKDWRMPEGAVYVGRPTRWGNPFSVHRFGLVPALEYFSAFCRGEMPKSSDAKVLEAYRSAEHRLYRGGPAILTLGELARIFLRGKDLACWCPLNQPCHSDVLLELANEVTK